MSSIKDEPTKGESPVNGHPPLPHNESTNPSTVKCEWSLKESCACADGQCEDCQASDEEDEKDDISLTMTPAASPLNERETDETEFHPPEWEDCEEADDTGAACDAALEDVKQVFGPGDDTLADGPIIENIDNVEEEGNASEEMHVEEASQGTDHVNSLSRKSTRERMDTLTAQAVDEMLAEGENEANNHQLTIIQQANTAQRNQEVFVNNEGNGIASTEPDEEEEADQAGATVSSLPLRRSTRVRNRPVNYAVLPEAEEEAHQDDPNTGSSDSEESDSDESETEIDSEMETDDPSETEGSSSIGAGTSSSDGRHSRKAFPCQFCGKELSSRQSARFHEETVHQVERPRPFACSVTDCGKAFLSKVALEVHTRTHSGSKPFTCATCGETFNQKGNLKRHKMTHTDARPYVCAVCGKTFKRKQDLVRHSLLHSALKPCFTCADCGVSFSRKDYLKVHRKVIIDCASRYTPSERRPFACTVAGCGRAFQRKSELKIHLLTHSGAKAFKCTVCGGTFTRKGTLQKHSRDIHGI